jgi:undecaprenyl-diphosphatase
MPVHFASLAVLAALEGLTEALPVSRSGHEVVARVWLDAGAQAPALATVLRLATALALVAVARRRLAGALGEGVRAVSRPALFRASPSAHDAVVLALGTVVSLLTGAFVLPHVEMWSESPTAAGIGLCVTGLSLASLALAGLDGGDPHTPGPAGPLRLPASGAWGRRAAQTPGPSLVGAVVVGIAVGLAVFPGASRVGAALTLLLWMGVKPGRAVDLAFLLAVPSLLVAFFARAPESRAALDWGAIALGLLLAFVGAAVGSELLRMLVERRKLAALALWTIPLGLALLAYARALPLPS